MERHYNMIRFFTNGHGIQTLIFLLLISVPFICNADCQVTLQWDATQSTHEGYQVFGREEGQAYDYDTPWWEGDDSFVECTIDQLDENKTYFFVVRAYAGDDVSADSNEVRYSNSSDPSFLGENNTASSGGGSSGGCFLQSLCRF